MRPQGTAAFFQGGEKVERLTICEIDLQDSKRISEQNTTTRLDEYLMSLSKDVVAKIMQDQAAVLELIGRLHRTLDAKYLRVYGGFLKDELIAYVSLACCEDMPEIQIEVLPGYQGRGFGYEMLERAIRMAFEEFALTKLKYVVIPSNLPSIALVEKLGGVLQEPKSYAEEMLLRTYVIE